MVIWPSILSKPWLYPRIDLVDILLGEFQGFWSICWTDGELETVTQALDFTNTTRWVSPNTAGFDVNLREFGHEATRNRGLIN